MSNKLVELLVAAACSAVILAFAHLSDWKMFKEKPKPPLSYVAGLVLLGIPYLGLLAYWRYWWAFFAFVAVVGAGGSSVLFGYKIRAKTEDEECEQIAIEQLEDALGAIERLRILIYEQDQDILRLMKYKHAKEKGDGC